MTMTADDFCFEDKTYRIAFVKADGSWDYVNEFEACDDEAANAYAEETFPGKDWFVIDADGNNING
jgi:mannose-1-phosphate guanylyltransferase